MSSTLRASERPERSLLTASAGPTAVTSALMPHNNDFTLTAGTYTFTVIEDGVTKWSQAGVVIADGHVYSIPRITSADSGTTAGTVSLVV